MTLLEVVVGLVLPAGSQLQCSIMDMPVLEMKYEKMSPYSYLGSIAHIGAPIAALIGRIGVVFEGDTCYFQFLLISLLADLIGCRVMCRHIPSPF